MKTVLQYLSCIEFIQTGVYKVTFSSDEDKALITFSRISETDNGDRSASPVINFDSDEV
jgi:hypothetical protein